MNGFLGPGGRNDFSTRNASSTSTNSVTREPQFYTPFHNEQMNPSVATFSTNGYAYKADEGTSRLISRTPSPTPSEVKVSNKKGLIDYRAMMNWKFWIRKEWLWYYVIGGIFLAIAIVISVYDKQIVYFLQPRADKIKHLPAGWVIPIAIFFILSFPPLFGHEVLAILVGLVWGLWVGFAITAAGTYLGEVGNFYAFKYFCAARGKKMENSRIDYACLARIVRDGGLKVAIVARFSAIPGHFTTAIFSTCGMSFWVFSVAAFVSLPKQFITVYLGYVLQKEGSGQNDTKNKIISYSVVAVSTIVTFAAFSYLGKKTDQVKHEVVYERRKARQEKLQGSQQLYSNASAAESGAFDSRHSNSDLPLNPGESAPSQQWDARGNGVGYGYSGQVGDPRLAVVAPTPKRPIGGGAYGPSTAYAASSSSSAGTSAAASPAPASRPPAMQSRQESTDVVGWDTSVHGAYNLPAIREHSPFSGDFGAATSTAYAPPAGPPPVSQLQQGAIHHSPWQSTGNDVSTSRYQPPPPVTISRNNDDDLLNERLANPYVLSDADLTPTPRQQSFGVAFSSASELGHSEPQASPQSGGGAEPDNFPHLPSPQYARFGRHDQEPQPPNTGAGADAGAFSPNQQTQSPVGHTQETTLYYTPPHSRFSTGESADDHVRDEKTEAATSKRMSSPPPPRYQP